MRILISAGEASGDLYAARVVEALRKRWPEAEFFGCAGRRMREVGVRPVVRSESIAVVGLVEVLRHIPRIYREYRKLKSAIESQKPDLAILVDSAGFHLRLAKRLKKARVKTFYLIAPQAWAWRAYRVRTIRKTVDRLLCIFPFEEKFFADHGIRAAYIGHPLASIVRPALTREEYFEKYQLPADRPLIALLPGSRRGEVERHMPYLIAAAEQMGARRAATFVVALPEGFGAEHASFWEPIRDRPIKVIEGTTWDTLARADLALAASGTVTMEAALLGVPMVTFYRVNELSWLLGRWLVRAPFLSMVNLIAGRMIVPELMQEQMTGVGLATEAERLLNDEQARGVMREGLAEVAAKLSSSRDPMETAADWIEEGVERQDGSCILKD